MIICGKDIELLEIVSGTVWDGQIQPAGADLSVESVHAFESAGEIDGDNSKRRLPECKKLEFSGGILRLEPGAYKIVFNETVSVPADAAGIARSRSSLLRMGAFVASAVWDPGYKGRSEALLVVQNPHGLALHERAKVAQIVFMRLERASGHIYSGAYQGENLGGKKKGETADEKEILDSI
ncbi:MAG: deoxyuridine 5'-triphosphate nucleotidohydrolase [Candidatus Micrarchaeota archaeon]